MKFSTPVRSWLRCWRKNVSLFLLSNLLVVTPSPALTLPGADPFSTATLQWDPSTDPNVTGYKVYYGTISHDYTNVVVVGNVLTTIISGLQPGTTYYFAVTAYDAFGTESDFSNEMLYTVPTTAATLTSATYSIGQFSFGVSGIPGLPYVIEASTNLVDWVAVQTNVAPFTFEETNTDPSGQRFFGRSAFRFHFRFKTSYFFQLLRG